MSCDKKKKFLSFVAGAVAFSFVYKTHIFIAQTHTPRHAYESHGCHLMSENVLFLAFDTFPEFPKRTKKQTSTSIAHEFTVSSSLLRFLCLSSFKSRIKKTNILQRKNQIVCRMAYRNIKVTMC